MTSRSGPALFVLIALMFCASEVAGADETRALAEVVAAYEEARSAKRWPDAIVAAQQLVELTAEETGNDSLATADAVTHLANTHFLAGDLVSAEADYLRAVTLIEGRVGTLNRRLVVPLRGLGLIYFERQQHDLAAVVLERAIQVSHRAEGLFNPDQMDLLLHLAETLTQLGQLPRAQHYLQYAVRVAEQSYGAEDTRVAEPLSELGRWYSRVGAYYSSRRTYLQAVDIIEKNAGPRDLALVRPLRGLAYNSMIAYMLGDPNPPTPADVAEFTVGHQFETGREDPRPGNRRRLSSDSEQGLLRAIDIQAGNPDADPLIFAATLIETGDWFTLKHSTDEALGYYKRAWPLLGEWTKTEPESRDLLLTYPVQIYLVPPISALWDPGRSEEQVVEKYVLVEFTVTPQGGVTEVRVVDSDASGRQVKDTVRAIEGALYRPRFVDGEPAVTTGVRHRQVFRERLDPAAAAESAD